MITRRRRPSTKIGTRSSRKNLVLTSFRLSEVLVPAYEIPSSKHRTVSSIMNGSFAHSCTDSCCFIFLFSFRYVSLVSSSSIEFLLRPCDVGCCQRTSSADASHSPAFAQDASTNRGWRYHGTALPSLVLPYCCSLRSGHSQACASIGRNCNICDGQ